MKAPRLWMQRLAAATCPALLTFAAGCRDAEQPRPTEAQAPPAEAAPAVTGPAAPPPGAADLAGPAAAEFAKLDLSAAPAPTGGAGDTAAAPAPAVGDAGAPPTTPTAAPPVGPPPADGAAAPSDGAPGAGATAAPAAVGAAPPTPTPQDFDPSAVSQAGIPTLAVRGFVGTEATGFRVSYAPTDVPAHRQLVDILKEIRLYETIATELNATVKLPRTIDIQLVDCGTVNAFYDPNHSRIIMCNELMTYFADVFRPTAKDTEQLGNAILGATVFSFFHEAGHGLIHLLDLPSTGREEDAVDQFATLILIAGGEESVAMALQGAYWFQLQAQQNRETPFYDEHAFDAQRYYNILCWIYGSDPARYAEFVSSGTLPEARAARCPEEYARTRRSWDKLLEPHLTRAAVATVEDTGAPAAPPSPPAAPPREPAAEPTPTAAPPGDEPTTTDEPAASADAPSEAAVAECRELAERVAELIVEQLDEEYREATQEQVDAIVEQLKVQLPQVVEQLTDECVTKAWSAKARACVRRAKTIKAASACGV